MKLSGAFNNKQAEIIRYDRKHKPYITMLEGSIRTGKTFLNNILWVNHIRQFKDQNVKFLMVGFTVPALKKNVLDEIEDFFGIDCRLNSYNEFKLFGNTVCCFGSDKSHSYKSMRGLTSFGVYFNEMTLLHENSIDEAYKRCSGEGTRIFCDTNPSYPTHPIKTDIVDRDGELFESGRIRIKSWHFVLRDNAAENNGFLNKEYIQNIEKSFALGFRKDRAIWGKWTASDGVIYTQFNENMIVDRLPPMKRYFAGVDWGYRHSGVILIFGEDHDGNVYLVEETAKKGKVIDWWMKEKSRYTEKYGSMVWFCDSARPEYVEKFNGVEAKKEVVEGLETVATFMEDGRFFVFRDCCKNWMKEIYSYEWRNTEAKEEPVKENDDSMDAMRYAIHTLFEGFKPISSEAVEDEKEEWEEDEQGDYDDDNFDNL